MSNARTGRAVLVALVALLAVSLTGASAGAAASPTQIPDAESPLDIGAPAGLPAVLASLILGAVRAATDDALSAARIERPPACRYKDKRTRYYKVRYWRKTLLDTNLKIRRSYEPWDLVSVRRAGLAGSGRVRKIIIPDLKAMARQARKVGKPLAVRSAYRSYATQVATFDSWVRRSGYRQALKFSARPGHSEHQLGTTIDFTVAPGQPLSSTFGNSPQGKWMARNAWKFGFINPYPKGKHKISCYGYEPWHWRYVGRDLAARIHDSGLVPRVYYWNHFETAP